MRNVRYTSDGHNLNYVIDSDSGARLGAFAKVSGPPDELWATYGISPAAADLPNSFKTRDEAVAAIVAHADKFPDHQMP